MLQQQRDDCFFIIFRFFLSTLLFTFAPLAHTLTYHTCMSSYQKVLCCCLELAAIFFLIPLECELDLEEHLRVCRWTLLGASVMDRVHISSLHCISSLHAHKHSVTCMCLNKFLLLIAWVVYLENDHQCKALERSVTEKIQLNELVN